MHVNYIVEEAVVGVVNAGLEFELKLQRTFVVCRRHIHSLVVRSSVHAARALDVLSNRPQSGRGTFEVVSIRG